MRAAFRRQGHARGGRGKQEAGVLVAGIVQRIAAAHDEGIIERADGEQAFAEQRMGEAERRQHQEEVHLGDAEFHMLALGREVPVEGRGNALRLEEIGEFGAGEEAAPVHPWPQIGRDRHVRRGRDDVARELAVALADLVEDEAEGLLGAHLLRGAITERGGHRDLGRLEAPPALGEEGHVLQERGEVGVGEIQPFEVIPLMAFAHLHGGAEGVHLGRGHQPRMVILVPREGQALALHGIGDEADGAVVIDLLEGFEQQRQVVAAEIAHELCQRRIVVAFDQG